jgi:hypothetical protein
MNQTHEESGEQRPAEDTSGHGVTMAAGGPPCAICSAVTPICWRSGFSCGRFRKQWSAAVPWPIGPYSSSRAA